MKERPILFQPDMVRAILDGRKTMTRRIMKPQPKYWQAGWKDPLDYRKGTVPLYWWEKDGAPAKGCTLDEYLPFCPYGQPEDVLWVREQWAQEHTFPNAEGENRNLMRYIYRADRADHVAKLMKWKPSIHMPKEACRLRLRITDVRVERVSDITDADAEKEGFTARVEFVDKWVLINGIYSWLNLSWVWVIEFERI